MPTYQIGGADRADSWQPVPIRSLTCEKCGAALGTVSAVQPHAGMTAATVCGVCPAARPGVERHEQECYAGTGEGREDEISAWTVGVIRRSTDLFSSVADSRLLFHRGLRRHRRADDGGGAR